MSATIKLTPRAHQREASQAIKTEMAVDDRALVVQACATGKTLVALWAAEDLNAEGSDDQVDGADTQK
jgi:superfamily II DNA or RNA helicase